MQGMQGTPLVQGTQHGWDVLDALQAQLGFQGLPCLLQEPITIRLRIQAKVWKHLDVNGMAPLFARKGQLMQFQ